MTWMFVMLVFLPISLVLNRMDVSEVWVFVTAALAIVPLAGFMGTATEELAKHLGASIGGLLNATFGNATELIITIIAVRAGEPDVVRASLVGSIVGNVLLVLGLSVFLGGLKYKTQRFSKEVAGAHTVTMILAVIALFIPSLFIHRGHVLEASRSAENLSLWVSGLLIVLYLSSLLFSLRTHQDMFRGGKHADEEEAEPPSWNKRTAFLVLAGATALVAWESELLVHSIGPTVQTLKLSAVFVGVIVVPIIGNAAEHATAVVMALKNKMDVTLNICVSSSIQIALFVAPLIVFLSHPLGHPISFTFSEYELISVGFAVVITAFITRDGECNWFEGAQLLTVYAILALAFYFVGAPVQK